MHDDSCCRGEDNKDKAACKKSASKTVGGGNLIGDAMMNNFRMPPGASRSSALRLPPADGHDMLGRHGHSSSPVTESQQRSMCQASSLWQAEQFHMNQLRRRSHGYWQMMPPGPIDTQQVAHGGPPMAYHLCMDVCKTD